jgi:selenophosphate synthetase-related protein
VDNFEKRKTPINEFGKFRLIEHITKRGKGVNKSTVAGIGDDAAIIDSGRLMTLVSTDLLLGGIHFNLIYSPLKHLEYKAVIRAISDIYAMNGDPLDLFEKVSNIASVKVIGHMTSSGSSCSIVGDDESEVELTVMGWQ